MLTRLFIGKDINQAKNTFVWTALSGIVYSLQSLVFLIILTNLMGKSAAGLYSLGIMIANQMLTVGKYSVRNYQVSDINEKYTFEGTPTTMFFNSVRKSVNSQSEFS